MCLREPSSGLYMRPAGGCLFYLAATNSLIFARSGSPPSSGLPGVSLQEVAAARARGPCGAGQEA